MLSPSQRTKRAASCSSWQIAGKVFSNAASCRFRTCRSGGPQENGQGELNVRGSKNKKISLDARFSSHISRPPLLHGVPFHHPGESRCVRQLQVAVESRSAEIDQGSPAGGSVVFPVALLKFFHTLSVEQLRTFFGPRPPRLLRGTGCQPWGDIAVADSAGHPLFALYRQG